MDTDSLQAILDELTKMRTQPPLAAKLDVYGRLTFIRGPPAIKKQTKTPV